MPIYKGSTGISKLYRGSTEIMKGYRGSQLFFDSAPAVTDPLDGLSLMTGDFGNTLSESPGFGLTDLTFSIYGINDVQYLMSSSSYNSIFNITTSGIGVTAWISDTTFKLNFRITDTSRNDHLYECTDNVPFTITSLVCSLSCSTNRLRVWYDSVEDSGGAISLYNPTRLFNANTYLYADTSDLSEFAGVGADFFGYVHEPSPLL